MVTDYPLWAEIAFRELLAGVEEIPGHVHHLRILDYHATTSLKASADEVPWCSAGLNWVMRMAGLRGTDSAAARSWMGWGNEIMAPRPGCVAVLWRGERHGERGHVGLWLADAGSRMMLLGGNQSDRWTVAPFPRDRLIGYRWPGELTRFL